MVGVSGSYIDKAKSTCKLAIGGGDEVFTFGHPWGGQGCM